MRDVDFSFTGDNSEFLQIFPDACNTGGLPEILIAGGTEFTALAGDVATDMLRRDFTINAAAIDAQGRLFCHPRFLDDLCASLLHLSSPHVLEEDPLRVFRAARFATTFPDFRLERNTVEHLRDFCRKNQERLAALPKERVWRELLKALSAAKPSLFFKILKEIEGMQPWFSELVPAVDIPAGPLPWHENTLFEHTLEVMDRCAGSPLAVWMALCHDLGKIETESSILPHHYGHEKRGVELSRRLGEKLGVPRNYLYAGMAGAELHMKGGMYNTLRIGTRRDMVFQLWNTVYWSAFWTLVRADGGKDWEPLARREGEIMSQVKLPKEWQNRGALSGEHLRLLQCQAISRLSGSQTEQPEKSKKKERQTATSVSNRTCLVENFTNFSPMRWSLISPALAQPSPATSR